MVASRTHPRSHEGSRSEIAKRHSLLQALHRAGTASRLTLARELHISNSRVCDLIDEMVDEGLLREQSAGGAERRGRRGVDVSLNPGFGSLLGFDMDAKRLRAVVTDFAGRPVFETRRPLKPPRDKRALVAEIFDFIDSTITAAKVTKRRLLGVGLAASGVIDTRRGVILHYDPIPQAVDLPLRDLIAEHLGVPCVMENNIRALTLAEWTDGAAKGLDSFVCLAVRGGVGAGVVLDGRLLAGSHGFAGEAGYMVLPCGPTSGGWRNLQQTVSESALGLEAEIGKDAKEFSIPEPLARRTGELIGSQLASIAALLDPQAIILAGEMLRPERAIWPHVLSTFRRVGLAELTERVAIEPARLGPFAAAIGAAHRCLYELFPVSAN